MKVVKGNKTKEITAEELIDLASSYNKVILDFGTGDGRFIFKNAQQNSENFYIGIDPSHKQLEIYSKKAAKNKLENTMFVVGSLEVFPEGLEKIAEDIFVILPWGSLLEKIVKADQTHINTLVSLLKMDGRLTIIFGYSQDAEPGEVERLELQNLTEEHIRQNIIPAFETLNLKLLDFKYLSKEDLQNFESTWSKKLTFGQDRPIFLLNFKKLV